MNGQIISGVSAPQESAIEAARKGTAAWNAFVESVRAANKHRSKKYKQYVTLSGADLSRINLQGANLAGVNLYNV